MKWNDNVVRLRPQNEQELYPFLARITQEWQFLADAWALEMPGVTASDVSAVANVRNEAVDLFNRWIAGLTGQQWFRVIQRYETQEDTVIKQKMILVTAGSRILVEHCCEQVKAHIRRRDRTLISPDGGEVPIRASETVELQCIIAPPRNDELRVLPLGVVPAVSVFNH